MKARVVRENEEHYKVRFSPEDLPTVGCNGFLIRRSAFEALGCTPGDFFHIDVNYEIIKMGMTDYGIVKNDIIHAMGDTFMKSIKKRIKYMGMHHQKMGSARRYKIFDPSNPMDLFNLAKFILFGCTFIVVRTRAERRMREKV